MHPLIDLHSKQTEVSAAAALPAKTLQERI